MSTLEYRRLLTVRQVADHLGVSRSTVRRRIRLGEISAVKLGSEPQAAVRIDPAELEIWLYGIPPAAPSPPSSAGRRHDPEEGLPIVRAGRPSEGPNENERGA